MSALSEHDAGVRINRSLSDIRSQGHDTAEDRRVALVRAFAAIAIEFRTLARASVREGRPLNPVELSRLSVIVRNALLQMRTAFIEQGEEAASFTDFVVSSLLAVHVGLITAAAGPEAGRAARDAFFDRVRRVPQQVQDDVRRLRRRDLEIPTLAALYAEEARTSAMQMLEQAMKENVNGDDVSNDLYLLLIGQDIDYDRYNLDRTDATPLRGFVAAGAAVAVSETFNSMTAGTSRTLMNLGLVRTGRWTLSARHASLSSSPDHCDTLAARDVGYGPGRYLLSQWPRPPHPFCGCSMTDVRLQGYTAWLSRFTP